jgi:hypothetical protein
MSTTRATVIVALFAIVSLLVIPIYPHFLSPNEFTRWALATAVVEHHTTEVSEIAPMLGPMFEDLARVDGRLYSNKAPGTAVVGTIGYLVARPFTTSIRPLLTAMRLVAATLPVILLALLVIALANRLGHGDRVPFVVAALLFGTPLFAYGLLLFSHALVAAALFAAWAFLFVNDRPVIAGALIGIAVASEYPAAIPALVLLIASSTDGRWSRLMKIIAGGLPFAVALAAYHYFSFGSVFRLPYGNDQYPVFRELSRSGIFGIQLPSPLTMLKFFFDPGFGLFVLSPVLILSLPAFVNARRELGLRSFSAFVLTPLSTILVYSGYPNWQGGWSVGARYILPIVPFLASALLFRKEHWLEPLLLGYSAVTIALVSLTFPFVPTDFTVPWGTLSMPLLRHGLVAPNLLHLLWRPLAIAVPFLLVALALILATERRFWLAALGGVIAISIGILAARQSSPVEQIERAYIEDVYFEQRGALDRAALPASPIFRRRAVETKLPPPSWPF